MPNSPEDFPITPPKTSAEGGAEYKDLSLLEKLTHFSPDQLKVFASAEGLPEDARPQQIAESMDARRKQAAQNVGLNENSTWDQINKVLDE